MVVVSTVRMVVRVIMMLLEGCSGSGPTACPSGVPMATTWVALDQLAAW